MIIYLLFTLALFLNCAQGINWQTGDWALGCDFRGGDIGNAQIQGKDCGGRCSTTSGITVYYFFFLPPGPIDYSEHVIQGL